MTIKVFLMELFKQRIPDSKNESLNSLSLDVVLATIGGMLSFLFNYLVKTNVININYIYLNGLVIIGLPLTFLIMRFKQSKGKISRKWGSGVTFQMGWACAILVIDFFI